MTATMTHGSDTNTAQQGEADFTQPTREQVVKAYTRLGISEREANAFLFWMEKTVISQCRNNGFYHVGSKDICTHCGVLDLVLPQGEIVSRSSAFALTERLLLDPGLGEISLTLNLRLPNGKIHQGDVQIGRVPIRSIRS